MSVKVANKIAQNELEKRNLYWPKLKEDRLWNRLQNNKGFATIPRSMPNILLIIDDLSSGKPLSKTYFELFCRDFNDQSFIIIKNPQVAAFSSGFRGQRSLSAWLDRMRTLKELGFIDAQKGQYGEFSYVLIWNPYQVIKEHHKKNTQGMRTDSFNALVERASSIGAIDELQD